MRLLVNVLVVSRARFRPVLEGWSVRSSRQVGAVVEVEVLSKHVRALHVRPPLRKDHDVSVVRQLDLLVRVAGRDSTLEVDVLCDSLGFPDALRVSLSLVVQLPGHLRARRRQRQSDRVRRRLDRVRRRVRLPATPLQIRRRSIVPLRFQEPAVSVTALRRRSLAKGEQQVLDDQLLVENVRVLNTVVGAHGQAVENGFLRLSRVPVSVAGLDDLVDGGKLLGVALVVALLALAR